MNGLNYFKGKNDPVALADEEYPEWLWSCLDVVKKDSDNAEDEGDEFCEYNSTFRLLISRQSNSHAAKSKKQRKLAAKRQRLFEQKILQSGDLTALAPKIPFQQQSLNLPGKEGGDINDALMASEKREELRKAMRKERKAKIKESNYLKSM